MQYLLPLETAIAVTVAGLALLIYRSFADFGGEFPDGIASTRVHLLEVPKPPSSLKNLMSWLGYAMLILGGINTIYDLIRNITGHHS